MSLSTLSPLKQWLAPPTFDDEEKTERARLQNVIFLGAIAIAVTYGLVTLVLESDPWLRLLMSGLWIVAAGSGL